MRAMFSYNKNEADFKACLSRIMESLMPLKEKSLIIKGVESEINQYFKFKKERGELFENAQKRLGDELLESLQKYIDNISHSQVLRESYEK